MNQENLAPSKVARIILKRLFDKALTTDEISRFIKNRINRSEETFL
jgi:hypothetical protein